MKYIGRNGSIPALIKAMKDVPKEERPAFGRLEDHPAQPFPDWTRRRGGLLLVKPFLTALWCRLTMSFKKGEKRAKAERRLLREQKKISGYAALAAYWKERAK